MRLVPLAGFGLVLGYSRERGFLFMANSKLAKAGMLNRIINFMLALLAGTFYSVLERQVCHEQRRRI
jgi:hypothetical protein